MDYITFALPKGRLATETMNMFNKIGITCDELNDKKSRKLIFTNEKDKYKFFLSKPSDVQTYVEYGVADIGIAGKDTLLEDKRNLYEVLDLGFGTCKIVVAGHESKRDFIKNISDLRVATKYPNITKDYFYEKLRKNIEIVKLNGSVELGAVIGLVDVIVDLVETGSTLKANNLQILDEICTVSARLVVNHVSMKIKHDRIIKIIEDLSKIKDDYLC